MYARTYPRDVTPHINLGVKYIDAGEYEKTIQEYLEAVRLDPLVATGYSNLVGAYTYLDKFDEAKAMAKQAFAQKLESPTIHTDLLRLAYIQNDPAKAEKEIQWAAGKPQEYASVGMQAQNAYYWGQRRKARELMKTAVDLAKRHNLNAVAAGYLGSDATLDAIFGDCDAARSDARSSIGLLDEDTISTGSSAVGALGLCGDAAQAQKIANQIGAQSQTDTLWNAVFLPSIQASIELKRDQPAKAIEVLAASVPYERGWGWQTVYLLGLAHFRAHQGPEAMAEFQKILSQKGNFWGPLYSLA